jgi:hypothetical protein
VLHVGDIVTCTGYSPGSGADPGYGVEFSSQQSEAARAFHCGIWPMHGILFDVDRLHQTRQDDLLYVHQLFETIDMGFQPAVPPITIGG